MKLPRGPLAAVFVLALALVALVGGGTVLGVGPLAPVPPDQVTDPREMLARSLQATLDASAVHLEGTLSGTMPGGLVQRPEPAVSLDGTTMSGDIRPKDGKTRVRLDSPGLGVQFDAVTVWDGVWYRTVADGPWQRASLGGASANAGVDINPLTLVDRLRGYLATPGTAPTVKDVACASASGRCHRVVLDAGHDPTLVLRAMLPLDRTQGVPVIRTVVTLDTDVKTLRPARLVIDATSDDGTVRARAQIDTSRWDAEDVVIPEPPSS